MFAIKSLPNLLNNDGPLPQGPETHSFEKPGDGDGIGTISENEDENKETLECRVEHGELASGAAKVDIETQKDDDSTAAVSESSSSSSSHLCTEIPNENDVTSPPPVTDNNNCGSSNGNSSDDSGIVSMVKLKEDVNDQEGKSICKDGEDPPLLVQQEDDLSLLTVEKISSVPSETEGTVAVSFPANADVKSPGITKQNNIGVAVLENQSNERKTTMELDTKTAPTASFGLDHDDARTLHAEAARDRDGSPSCKSQANEPSRAFGIGKSHAGKSKQRTISLVELHCKNDTIVQENKPKAEGTKSTSPISVADQMVSMLWVSSTAKRSNDEKNSLESIDAVTPETAIHEENGSDEDIEEITLDDDVIAHDDYFEEVIEEITVEDNSEGEDDISVASNNDFFENTAYIEVEVSQDFIYTVEKGVCDGHSYDGIAADDCEYHEKTIDDEVLQEDKEDDIESKEFQEEEVEVKTKVGARVEVTSGEEDSGHSDGELYGFLNLSRNDPKEKLAFETKARGEPKHNKVKSLATTFSIPSQTISTAKKTQDNRHIDSSNVGKLYPRITSNRSAGGKLTEKLKMFDSPKSVSAQSSSIIPKQSWKRGKPMPMFKSSTKEPISNSKKQVGTNPKISIVLPTLEPRSEQAVLLDEKPCNTSGYNEDEALVDKIVSLFKEPGAMQNKYELAERIKCLVIGQSKGKINVSTQKGRERIHSKVPTPNQSLHSDSSKPIRPPLSKSNNVVEANSYLNRKNDKFMVPGLKQMREDVKQQKQKLKHVDESDTAENRRMKIISITESEQESAKKPTMKLGFERAQESVDLEAIMARIWPKTAGGEKPKPTSPSLSSRVSKSTTSETQKMTPRKLGNRLKMFESPPPSDLSPRNNAGCFEKESTTESFKPNMRNISSSQIEAKISQETMRRLSMFQRLWRSRKLECSTDTKLKNVTLSKAKAVCAISPNNKSYSNHHLSERSIPTLFNAGDNSVQVPGSSTRATMASSRSPNSSGSNRGCCYSLEELEQGNFDRSVVDMERWEEFLSDESFSKHFGLTREDFYEQPKWKRDKQKRRIRVAF